MLCIDIYMAHVQLNKEGVAEFSIRNSVNGHKGQLRYLKFWMCV